MIHLSGTTRKLLAAALLQCLDIPNRAAAVAATTSKTWTCRSLVSRREQTLMPDGFISRYKFLQLLFFECRQRETLAKTHESSKNNVIACEC